MATAHEPHAGHVPQFPPVTREEQKRRNEAAIRLLDSFEAAGDEREQRESMDVLRKALGPERMGAGRAGRPAPGGPPMA